MQISEIFRSCQGEGVRAGLRTIFVRLQGCNLYPNGCSFCDTKYAQSDGGRRIDVLDVVSEIKRLSNGRKAVEITGGEPLYQVSELCDLVDRLKFHDYFIEVFTNSTLKPPTFYFLVDSWVADIKCPSSGASGACLVDAWFDVLRETDCVKFVVESVTDLTYVEKVLSSRGCDAQVLISPMIPNCPDSLLGEVLMSHRKWLQAVWEFCVEHDYRFSFQMHKLVYGNRSGV